MTLWRHCDVAPAQVKQTNPGMMTSRAGIMRRHNSDPFAGMKQEYKPVQIHDNVTLITFTLYKQCKVTM